jgi:hypothetical protein
MLRTAGYGLKEREMQDKGPLPLPGPEEPLDPDTPTPISGWQGPRIVRPFGISPKDSANEQAPQPPWRERVPPAWRKPGSWGIAGVVMLCLLLLFYAARPAAPPPVRQTDPYTKTFFLGGFLGGAPTLIFAHSIGNVHIHDGADGQVSIKEDRNGFPDAIHINYSQAGSTIHVTSDIENDLASDTWVDFDVSVPKLMGLSAALLNGGTLEADNLSGQITLSNTNGSVWATNDSGVLRVQTESGSINVSQFSGQMNLTTQNGTITTGGVHIGGRSSAHADTGTINFHGSLERKANVMFTDTNGQVSVNLPGHSAFHVQVQTEGGSVNSDFPGITIHPMPPGIAAEGDVGTPPRAQLTIQTTSGPVLLHQEG